MTQPFESFMKFHLYGTDPWAAITLDALLEMQRGDGDLWAHAEGRDRGCCHCEVARWNHARTRYERFAFCNCHDYRLPEMPDATDEATAEYAARLMNDLSCFAQFAPVVHSLPTWTGDAPARATNAAL